MNDDEKCGNCDYFYPLNGRCRLLPPVFVIHGIDTENGGRVNGEWEQAYVGPYLQCGQWAPKQDETPPYPPSDIPDQKVATRVRRQRERAAPIADVDAEIEHENDPESER